MRRQLIRALFFALATLATVTQAAEKPNIIVMERGLNALYPSKLNWQ